MRAKLSVRRRALSGAAAVLTLAAVAACTPTSTPPPVGGNQSFVTLARTALDEGRYEEARFLFQSSINDRQNVQQAYAGLGEVYLLEGADAGSSMTARTASYCSAIGSFTSAADSAPQGSGGADARADALTGRAAALMALYGMGAQGCTGSTAYRTSGDFYNAAISDYRTADGLDASFERQFQLANAYLSAGDLSSAHGALAAALERGGSNQQRISALIMQARIRAQMPGTYSDADVLATLEQAAALDPNSAEVNVARGAIYLDQGEPARAREMFERVRASGATSAGPGQPNPTAEAYYYLSVLDTLGSPSNSALETAVSNAEAAVRAGGGDFRYRRQACVAHIMRGEDRAEGVQLNSDLGEWCTGNTNTPEGLLLRGMSSLRLAQYAQNAGNQSRWEQNLRSARSDFQQGAGLAPSAARLDWPGRASLSVRDLLRFGDAVIYEGCSRRIPQTPDFTPETSSVADLAAFYRSHRVFACRLQS